MKTALLPFTLLVSLALSPAGQAADAQRQARVATGAKVTLVNSGRTPAQWTAARPQVRDLRPRVRGTFD